MIRFESLTATSFALYPQLTLQFSVESTLPLTLIRGENESGKTTLMRAFVWGLFGGTALPRMPEARHPVRPVWAKPGEAVRTKVIEPSRSSSSFAALKRRMMDNKLVMAARPFVSCARKATSGLTRTIS